jgi:glycosyltransferase involved in cell wall biosynthesis
MEKKVLFISYDGLLDPLGQSQIMPYLIGIKSFGWHVSVVSFEKKRFYANENYETKRSEIFKIIEWYPLLYSSKYGKLAKIYDLFKMILFCSLLVIGKRHTVLHCRSYQAMLVGCLIKVFTRVQLIFDMRGLWIDDRVDGDAWPQSRTIYRLAYKISKYIEVWMLKRANHIIVLTRKAELEVAKIAKLSHSPISVIPCCADFDYFKPDINLRGRQREKFGFGKDEVVLVYAGSIGTVYLFNEMIRMFLVLSKRYRMRFLVISHDWGVDTLRQAEYILGNELFRQIIFTSGTRDDMPKLLSAADIAVSFRKASYSQLACFPTKFAESLAFGLPVISNSGVGDMDSVTEELNAGQIVDLDEQNCFEQIDLIRVLNLGGPSLRERARKLLGIEHAYEKYRTVYENFE